jgi:hypothetical protein
MVAYPSIFPSLTAVSEEVPHKSSLIDTQSPPPEAVRLRRNKLSDEVIHIHVYCNMVM